MHTDMFEIADIDAPVKHKININRYLICFVIPGLFLCINYMLNSFKGWLTRFRKAENEVQTP